MEESECACQKIQHWFVLLVLLFYIHENKPIILNALTVYANSAKCVGMHSGREEDT